MFIINSKFDQQAYLTNWHFPFVIEWDMDTDLDVFYWEQEPWLFICFLEASFA